MEISRRSSGANTPGNRAPSRMRPGRGAGSFRRHSGADARGWTGTPGWAPGANVRLTLRVTSSCHTNPPVPAASAGALPTSFTIAPGDYEFTMTFANADGESVPSAVVTLTVG